MDDNSKEKLLQKKRECSRKMRSQSAGKQPAQPRSIEQTDIEFDSALFEPTNNESDEGVSYFYIFSTLVKVLITHVRANIMQMMTIWRHLMS